MNALKAEYGFTHFEWKFFAASHAEKMPSRELVEEISVDAVKSRKTIVNSVLEFEALALSKNVSFIFVAEEEVKEKMDDKWEKYFRHSIKTFLPI
ncbi:hypothetical protein TNIN_496541 [Trichonephila inaurata madagascariensis]|uniref:Uncharacterized protein n=1 Tax=Trichonephila inaurata madagascariensis TaxID=2747483 RepID=A0A8X6XKX2_9ARAC|nr:hypothetical protein TNIN_496541 [Trichonephila inaurata madagascariensis]